MDDDDLIERIRQRAYELWEADGQPEGRELEHWLQAEQELRERGEIPPDAEIPKPEGVPSAAPPAESGNLSLSAVAEGMRETDRPVSPDGGARGRVAKARRKDAIPPG